MGRDPMFLVPGLERRGASSLGLASVAVMMGSCSIGGGTLGRRLGL